MTYTSDNQIFTLQPIKYRAKPGRLGVRDQGISISENQNLPPSTSHISQDFNRKETLRVCTRKLVEGSVFGHKHLST